MRLLTILILATLLTAQKYMITIDIEVESLQKAGEVEKVVLDRLKEYKPAIGIKTKVDVQRLFYGQTVDSIKVKNFTLELNPKNTGEVK
jgi:PBP1b-binding outer membrane lipoprotein LpoB